MQTAPIPHNENARLQALYDLDILDTAEEQVFDDITQLAAEICDVPIALISLIDSNRQFLKSHYGLDVNEISRELGFCPHAILDDEVTVVEDSLQDLRFHDNPLVTGGVGVKFYAGAPLIVDDDIRIGTLCIVDQEARHLSPKKLNSLKILSRHVVDQLKLRKNVKDLKALNDNHLKTLEELKESKSIAEKSSQAKSEFLSSMSHELRTPLNVIMGFGYLLEMRLTDSKNIGFVHNIQNASNHLLELINDVLDLAKIDSGNLNIEIKSVNISQTIGMCIELVQHQVDDKNIDLKYIPYVTPNNKPLHINADLLRIKQIILNLISNAIKYNKQDGTVEINVETVSFDNKPFVRISIQDSGMGISNKYKEDVFKPFDRLGREGQAIEGTGIGLSICKRLAEAMGGSIGFSSEEGKGSTFWLTLPK